MVYSGNIWKIISFKSFVAEESDCFFSRKSFIPVLISDLFKVWTLTWWSIKWSHQFPCEASSLAIFSLSVVLIEYISMSTISKLFKLKILYSSLIFLKSDHFTLEPEVCQASPRRHKALTPVLTFFFTSFTNTHPGESIRKIFSPTLYQRSPFSKVSFNWSTFIFFSNTPLNKNSPEMD